MGDLFGTSVGISGEGDRVVVGGPWNGDNGVDSGHTKVYEYNEEKNLWEQLGDDILGEDEDDESGLSVSINDKGDVVIIGAKLNNDNGTSSGHARIYRYINGQWEKQGQDLDGDDIGNRFG